ncbi:MAG TPA: Tex family protein [Candidatus Deferrimicrobium sp.]|nr:Tex family protein [Candidatus Deferrimicrobium sp.]
MIIQQIAKQLNIKESQVKSAVQLLDEGNTIPFIARYRKEVTGELDENVLRAIEEKLNYLRNLAQRKEEVIRLIDEQGKLTPELQKGIEQAKILQEVEDLYRPYKQKRRTRATIAKEKGLEPLAHLILAQEVSKGAPTDFALQYVNLELGVENVEVALAGAQDIIAEIISDDAIVRKQIREFFFRKGQLVVKGTKAGAVSPYEMYYEYSEALGKIPPHRILAINRGEKEEFLSAKVEAPEEVIVYIARRYVKEGIFAPLVKAAGEDGYKRLIAPSIEREVRAELTSVAEEQAIKVFSANLHNLLLQPPIRGKNVLALDPGYRTGCKLAVVDETGKLLEVGVIYPHPPQNKLEEAKAKITRLVEGYKTDIVAIGNGTASRETEAVIAELIKHGLPVQYIMVSEAGASIYSASKLAAEEFPDLDLSLRSAVSIARRLQDPLAELVKIEPKGVGVGQYQHDITAKRLDESLKGVVEDCVNSVGVDLNTASPSLLQYVAGLKPAVAKNVVAYREKLGKFRRRSQLKEVPRLGEQSFVQAAGFLRLPDGDNPLENTPVHPESYTLAKEILGKIGFTTEDLRSKGDQIRRALGALEPEEVAAELNAGVPTVRDIIFALQRPGRDLRDELPKPILHSEITTMESLRPGMVLQGTVRNVVDFGAFVDIGVKQDGLVHISQLSDKYIKHPMEAVAIGDIVKVKVLAVDLTHHRISLTMKEVD